MKYDISRTLSGQAETKAYRNPALWKCNELRTGSGCLLDNIDRLLDCAGQVEPDWFVLRDLIGRY